MELKELIAQADIVEYIAQFCELKERNGEWWGLSPLKDEQTPSFSIDKNKQLFYDFSSGKGGDVLDLEVMVIPKPSTNRSLTQKCV